VKPDCNKTLLVFSVVPLHVAYISDFNLTYLLNYLHSYAGNTRKSQKRSCFHWRKHSNNLIK